MKTFSALLALCKGNSPVTGEFLSQRPVTRSYYVFFDVCLNKRLSKQSRCWWSETPWRSLWRRCNVFLQFCWITYISWTFHHKEMRAISSHQKFIFAVMPMQVMHVIVNMSYNIRHKWTIYVKAHFMLQFVNKLLCLLFIFRWDGLE